MQRPLIILTLMTLCMATYGTGCERSGCTKGAKTATALLGQVEEFRLDNGMVWLLVERGEAPVFTGVVYVKVGGIEERRGKAGLAHMFEHMAFKGSREIGTTNPADETKVLARIRAVDKAREEAQAAGDADTVASLLKTQKDLIDEAHAFVVSNELWQLFHSNGAAELNAFTGKDMTAYYARMPANMLGLWIYLNAEMIGTPVMRDFYPERDVVKEERRSSVDNSPRGQLYEAFLQTAFAESPYGTMTIGSMEELNGLSLGEAEAFHRTYYRPNRMVGVLVGQFDRAEAKAAIQEHFGALTGKAPDIDDAWSDLSQTQERRVEVVFDAGPQLFIGYHKPPLPHRDDYVFDAIQFMLCEGESGRLRRRLEQELKMAREVGCRTSSPGSRLENLFLIEAQPLEGHTSSEIIEAIEAELARLRTDLVESSELRKSRHNLRANFLWGLNDNEALAQQLGYFQTVANDWKYIVTHSEMMETITAEDVRAVAKRYLNPGQRTIGTLRRPQ